MEHLDLKQGVSAQALTNAQSERLSKKMRLLYSRDLLGRPSAMGRSGIDTGIAPSPRNGGSPATFPALSQMPKISWVSARQSSAHLPAGGGVIRQEVVFRRGRERTVNIADVAPRWPMELFANAKRRWPTRRDAPGLVTMKVISWLSWKLAESVRMPAGRTK